MSEKLVIWGASSHAMVVADAVDLLGSHEIVGFLDDLDPERAGTEFLGRPVLGGGEQLPALFERGVTSIVIAIGTASARLRLAAEARSNGFQLVTVIHPGATVARDVNVGAGGVILAGSVVNSGARIGESVIIETCACIEHECSIADGAMISAGVRLGGGVTVGRAATIEIGSTVARRLRIGPGAVIGAGSLVLHDVPDRMLAYGSPAKLIRPIENYGY